MGDLVIQDDRMNSPGHYSMRAQQLFHESVLEKFSSIVVSMEVGAVKRQIKLPVGALITVCLQSTAPVQYQLPPNYSHRNARQRLWFY